MGILDLFKAKENNELKEEIKELKKLLNPEQQEIANLVKEIDKLKIEKDKISKEVDKLFSKKQELSNKIKLKKKDLILLDDEILMQEFGLYKPIYDFESSEKYKQAIDNLRVVQKEMIKNKSAVIYSNNWTVDGSKAKGRKMTNDNIKQIIMAFNIECDNLIAKVKYNNIQSIQKRIEKTFERLNKLNESNQVRLTSKYLECKLSELKLVHEYQVKKQEEKEEQKRIREELREEAKLKKELEEAKKNTLKDITHFENALSKLNEQLKSNNLSDEEIKNLQLKKEELEKNIDNLNLSLKDIDYRQENQRAGYVYIISNIGAFGKDVYKIGMTRRLEPMDRIDELGDASVPFNFDVHAMIFADDAPKLENALHKAFENKKLNMVNQRREFFNVTLEEIEKVVKENFDKTVEFKKEPEAEQFRQSLKIKDTVLTY
ncbi:DUF4041 domain-containing protein [Clostridium perfringens]|uniref:DUF4041 domain-containing protein n=1 Tax=Clostridium perfringens TaxID=1502 RepID=A0AAP4AAU3_CLOPF|nr:DUF4041 domain-containing protein [Clostridium perfringens]EJT6664080.1 DUF4041 domain-containing protein [Clostridium perfringens]MDH2336104.1 DUF4041 domain-containing protein [Clostridium perfringens]MDK0706293.1 DUF4041 domain-containing protein [Clostridium perfringens]MDU2435652.1 DUF4041 domain-containing protein [Clostridium perfringens]MDU2516602.1 DUF4041 domain-containing protein [Clostridium perfringens]